MSKYYRKIQHTRGNLTTLGVYASEERKKSETEDYYEELLKEISKYNRNV
jgi:hypothetical protein